MRTKTLALAGLAAVLLTACGGGNDDGASAGSSSSSSAQGAAGGDLAGKTGPQVASAAADALEKAGAVHVTGTVSEGETQEKLDLQLQGDDTAGTISMNGQTVELIATGGKVFAKAGAAFWTANGVPAAAVSQLDGVWVALPTESASQFGTLSLSGLTDELRNPTDNPIDKAVTSAQVGGRKVVLVTQKDGSTLAVAASGTAYPVQIKNTGDDGGTLTLADFGKKQTIAAPPSPLDLGQAGG